MRSRTILITAAAIAIGGYAFAPQGLAQDDPVRGPAERTGQQIDDAADRAGDAIRRGQEGTIAAPDAEDIRGVLAQVAEASVTKDGLDDLVERFVDADRNRLGEGDALTENLDHLNGIIAQFQQNWQARYNQEFDIKDEGAVFDRNFAMIIQGEIGEGARLAGERAGGVGTGIGTDTDARPDVTPGPESDRIAGGDVNREPGREVAKVSVQENHGLPSVKVPMIKEFPDAWKIDAPDQLTAVQLRTNLEKALTKLNENQEQWPANVEDGYRYVTHKILLAVMNQQEGVHEQPREPMPGEPTDRPFQPDQPGQMGQPGEPDRPR